MNTEIKDGFTKIESEEQLEKQFREHPGFYILEVADDDESFVRALSDHFGHGADVTVDGVSDSWTNDTIAKQCIAFRHVPDTAPVAESGFEKKTEFCGVSLKWLTEHEPKRIEGLSGKPLIIRDLAEEVLRAYTEINKQVGELAQLKAAREWVAIESAEQLEALPNGHYELAYSDRKDLSLFAKHNLAWFIAGNEKKQYSSEHLPVLYSHFRLITRAEDFTPPEREYNIGGLKYSRAELAQILGEQGIELKENE